MQVDHWRLPLPALRTVLFLVLSASLAFFLTVACVPGPSRAPSRVKGDVPSVPRLVAAGILKGDMATRSKVLNDLRIVKVASGQMTISFSGYRLPDEGGQKPYVVKVLPSKIGGMVVPTVTVDSFAADGIVLRVTDPEGKMLLPLKYLVEQEFSIEIAEIPPQQEE